MCIHVHCRGCAVSQADIRRPLTANPRIRFQVSSREICGGQSGTETGFSPRTPPFPLSASSHQSAILIFIYKFVLRGQMGVAWKLSKKHCSFVNLGALDRTALQISSLQRVLTLRCVIPVVCVTNERNYTLITNLMH